MKSCFKCGNVQRGFMPNVWESLFLICVILGNAAIVVKQVQEKIRNFPYE